MALFVHQLSEYEERILNNLVEKYAGNPAVCKRLQIVLLSNQRLKTSEIAEQLQITGITASHWIKQFNLNRLNCFEPTLLKLYSGQRANLDLDYPRKKFEEKTASTAPKDNALFVTTLTFSKMQEIQRLKELYQDNLRVLHHIQAILLSNEGFEIKAIAEVLGFPPQINWRIRVWIEQFNQYGLNSLVTKSDKIWLSQKQKL